MIRLIAIIFFFLIALLAVFKAPAYYLWLLAIGVTEYALVFIGITVLLLLAGIWVTPYRVAGNIIAALALVLYLSPIVRAYVVANGVESDMKKAFAGATFREGKTPFSIAGLFKTTPQVAYKTITYAT